MEGSGSCPEMEALAFARSRGREVKECGFVHRMAGSRRCLHLKASVFSDRLVGESPAESSTGGLKGGGGLRYLSQCVVQVLCGQTVE